MSSVPRMYRQGEGPAHVEGLGGTTEGLPEADEDLERDPRDRRPK